MSNPKFTSDLTGYMIAGEHTRPGDIPYTMGDWDGQRCPKCGSETLSNEVGERWCSLVGCTFIEGEPDE